MQTSVNLQENFTYSLIILAIIFLMIIIESFFLFSKRRKKEKNIIKEIPKKNVKNIPVIKNKYLNKLNSIEYKYIHNQISLRKAYQLISEEIRLFVFEITDITTQNYSLDEIKKINIPNLYDLIEEYYEPEFASKVVGDFNSSIKKARSVISEWK